MRTDRWIPVNPVVFQARGLTPKPDRAFVIMPFTPNWSNRVFDAIRIAMRDACITCVRTDEQFGHQILEDVWTGLCEASLVVADVTGRNPNVYYELGVAHVLGRRVILITQDVKDIPFDTRVYRHILYGQSIWRKRNTYYMAKLTNDLKQTVAWIQQNEIPPNNDPIAAAYAATRDLGACASATTTQALEPILYSAYPRLVIPDPPIRTPSAKEEGTTLPRR